MIGYICGNVLDINERILLVQVGSIGVSVYVSNQCIQKTETGKDVALWTHLHVKEGVLDLYGFETKIERSLFRHILGVSGIGPKSALSIISLAPAEKLMQAIAKGSTEYLTKVSGIGRKNAEKIVLELKDKVAKESFISDRDMSGDSDVIETLRALGYSSLEARDALQKVSDDIKDVNERIKESLKYLAK